MKNLILFFAILVTGAVASAQSQSIDLAVGSEIYVSANSPTIITCGMGQSNDAGTTTWCECNYSLISAHYAVELKRLANDEIKTLSLGHTYSTISRCKKAIEKHPACKNVFGP